MIFRRVKITKILMANLNVQDTMMFFFLLPSLERMTQIRFRVLVRATQFLVFEEFISQQIIYAMS